MNPFLLPPRERLEDWKRFRRDLTGSDEAQLAAVAAYFAQAPLMRCAYDPDDAKHWPTIWEMVHRGEWCRNATAIGMEATLRLAGWRPERLVLRHLLDRKAEEMLLVLVVDAATLLNYEWGRPCPMPSRALTALAEWQHDGRGYALHKMLEPR